MKNKLHGFLLMAAMLFVSAPLLAQLNLIPLPVKVEERGSPFVIRPQTKIWFEKGLKPQA